jgi:hypothetical protein
MQPVVVVALAMVMAVVVAPLLEKGASIDAKDQVFMRQERRSREPHASEPITISRGARDCPGARPASV